MSALRVASVLDSGFEDAEQFANAVVSLRGMPEAKIGLNPVRVPSADLGRGDVSGFFEIVEDALDRALGDTHGLGDIPDP